MGRKSVTEKLQLLLMTDVVVRSLSTSLTVCKSAVAVAFSRARTRTPEGSERKCKSPSRRMCDAG